ncbi:PQQ-binding-like beta-propeller repeat protein [Dactylosporangium sp. CS-033363]|uniref:outer membrane protein assembly factor BamB family protein n=1 Tax=Dactylosporangium sp. CS-033363 TaxID=3239935 RepID=UPI003D8E67A4
MVPRLLASATVAGPVRDCLDGGWLILEPAAVSVLSPLLEPTAHIPLPDIDGLREADFDGRRLVLIARAEVLALSPSGELLWRLDEGAEEARLAPAGAVGGRAPDGLLWLTRGDVLVALDALTGRELARTTVSQPMMTGPILSRFDDTPVTPGLVEDGITLRELGGAYVAGTAGDRYLSVGYEDDTEVSWHDANTGATLAKHTFDEGEPIDGCALVSNDYVLLNDLLLATRTLRPVGRLTYPVPTGTPRTSPTPGRWLTAGPTLHLWELTDPPGEATLF